MICQKKNLKFMDAPLELNHSEEGSVSVDDDLKSKVEEIYDWFKKHA